MNRIIDAVLGVLIRLSFLAVIAVMCLNVSTIYAAEYDGYNMVVVAVGPDGALEPIGGTYADTYDACVYNMGLIAATWYNKGYAGEVITPYTRIGNVARLTFWSTVMEDGNVYYIDMTCSPVELTV